MNTNDIILTIKSHDRNRQRHCWTDTFSLTHANHETSQWTEEV
jgi:hypothetical protein